MSLKEAVETMVEHCNNSTDCRKCPLHSPSDPDSCFFDDGCSIPAEWLIVSDGEVVPSMFVE